MTALGQRVQTPVHTSDEKTADLQGRSDPVYASSVCSGRAGRF